MVKGNILHTTSIRINQSKENIRKENGWMILKNNKAADPMAKTLTKINNILISGLLKK
jgi:hypothetical protein